MRGNDMKAQKSKSAPDAKKCDKQLHFTAKERSITEKNGLALMLYVYCK